MQGPQMSLCGRENSLARKRPGHVRKSKYHGPEKHQSGWRAHNNSGPPRRRLHLEDAGLPRDSRCLGDDCSRLVADARDRTSQGAHFFPGDCFGIVWPVRTMEVESKDIEVSTQARQSGFCWVRREFPNDHRISRRVHFQSTNACQGLQVRHEALP